MHNIFIEDIMGYMSMTFNNSEIIDYVDELDLSIIPVMINAINPTADVVIINIPDHLIYDGFEKTFIDSTPLDIPYLTSTAVKSLHALSHRHSKTNFVILQENAFIHRELLDLPKCSNLYFISSVSELFAEYKLYNTICPVIDKAESTEYILSLNNLPRPHRVGVVMYLIHTNLQEVTTMSLRSLERVRYDIPFDYKTFLDWAHWDDTEIRDSFARINESNFNGFRFLREEVFTEHQTNSKNFTNKLKHHYAHSFVEIVAETTCIEPSLCLTEKYVNSVFGCVFPILVTTQGAVQYLRDMGFDMFDDIIDHSYDSEPNHFYRMKKAIDLNYKWISNKQEVISAWHTCKQRFLSNVAHYNNNLYDQEYNRVVQDIMNIKSCIVT